MLLKINSKKYLSYSLLSLLSLLSLVFINKIDETNGMPILKLLKSNSHDKIINNNNNINNININININKINDTNNDEIIKPKLYNNNGKTEINNNYNNEIERIKTTEVLDKNYTINGTIIKQSIIYDMTINNFIGEVIIYYNNTYHKHYKHYYCKINIIIPTQVNASYITEYIYYYYNFDKKINLICNDYNCLELFNYNRNTNQNAYYKCTILDTIQLKDEL